MTDEEFEKLNWAHAEQTAQILAETRRARQAEAQLTRERDMLLADNAAMYAALAGVEKWEMTAEQLPFMLRQSVAATVQLEHPGRAVLDAHRAAEQWAFNDGLEAAAEEIGRTLAKAEAGSEASILLLYARDCIRALMEKRR